MSANYKVIFEQHNGVFKIAGVTNDKVIMNKIAGSVSSKGFDYTAVCIDYNCNVPLNDKFYVVYTRLLSHQTEDDGNEFVFHPMKIEGPSLPSENDIFLYKTLKSATDRVEKINDKLKTDGLENSMCAEVVLAELDYMYDVIIPEDDESKEN